MANHTEVIDYKTEQSGYIKVLLGLLLLTALTFLQPSLFLPNLTFEVQLLIGLAKAWLILMYYMHLKGEKLIGWTVVFAVFIVAFFFGIVMIDVFNFQFADVSHITAPAAVK